MWKRLRGNPKTILIFFILFGFIGVSTSFVYGRIDLNNQTRDTLKIMQIMPEESAVFIAPIYDKNVEAANFARVVAQYTDKTLYYCGDDISTGSWCDAFSNVQIVGDDSILDSLLEEGTTVYYISADEINSSTISSIGTGSYLGKYLFEYNTFVYEISPLEQ